MKYADRPEAYKERRREGAKRRYREAIKDPVEKERRLVRAREHYARDPAKRRAVATEWERANRDARKLITRRRKLRIQVTNELLPGEWEKVVVDCNNTCIVSGCGTSPVTMDHVVPLSKNGRHHISNLQPLCSSCNDKKGVKEDDYRD